MFSKKTLKVILLLVAVLSIVNAAVIFCLPIERALAFAWFDDWSCRNQRGFVSRVYVDDQGEEHKYAVFVPFEIDRSSPPPLILFLHGLAPSGEDGLNQLRECLGPAIWEMKNGFPFVVVFPQCSPDLDWSANKEPARLAMELLEKTAKEYGTDPDRVYLTGVSSGGNGVWSIAAAVPHRFAAIVPISGLPTNFASPRDFADAQLPTHSFYVRGDAEKFVNANRQMHQELISAGASPLFTEFDGTLSKTWWHHNAWSSAYRNQGVYDWMLRQTKSRNQAQAKKFQPLLSTKTSSGEPVNWVRTGPGTFTVNFDGVLTGQSPANASEQTLYTFGNADRNYEVHFEFHVDKGNGCRVFFPNGSDPLAKAGWRLDVVGAENGTGGLFETRSGKYLSVVDPIAQRAFSPSEWNDLRIRFQDANFDVELSGCPLMHISDATLVERTGAFALVLPANAESQMQWRNIRFRQLD